MACLGWQGVRPGRTGAHGGLWSHAEVPKERIVRRSPTQLLVMNFKDLSWLAMCASRTHRCTWVSMVTCGGSEVADSNTLYYTPPGHVFQWFVLAGKVRPGRTDAHRCLLV